MNPSDPHSRSPARPLSHPPSQPHAPRITTATTGPGDDLLGPKKTPQQERSRRMVKAVLDACEQILRDEPEGSLTMHNLEVVSGVGRGSVYQYFPSIDAIVAALYQRHISAHIDQWAARLEQEWPHLDFRAAVALIIESNLCCHRQLLNLNRRFFQQHSGRFDLNRHYTSIMASSEASILLFYRLLDEKYPQPLEHACKQMKAELLVTNLAATNLYTLQQHPDYFTAPHFGPLLLALALGILQS